MVNDDITRAYFFQKIVDIESPSKGKGKIYAADMFNYCVMICSFDGRILSYIGTQGISPGLVQFVVIVMW